MNQTTFYKSKFNLSDDNDNFEGYSNGRTWNGWACVWMTLTQVSKWLESTTYNSRIVNDPKLEYRQIVVDFEDGDETFNAELIQLEDGTITEAFAIEGFTWMDGGEEGVYAINSDSDEYYLCNWHPGKKYLDRLEQIGNFNDLKSYISAW